MKAGRAPQNPVVHADYGMLHGGKTLSSARMQSEIFEQSFFDKLQTYRGCKCVSPCTNLTSSFQSNLGSKDLSCPIIATKFI